MTTDEPKDLQSKRTCRLGAARSCVQFCSITFHSRNTQLPTGNKLHDRMRRLGGKFERLAKDLFGLWILARFMQSHCSEQPSNPNFLPSVQLLLRHFSHTLKNGFRFSFSAVCLFGYTCYEIRHAWAKMTTCTFAHDRR